MTVDFKKQVELSHEKIHTFVQNTPLIKAIALSELLNAEIYLKLENLQPTSSFKVRGAFNKILSLSPEEQSKGIVAASSGNHGAAVAYASKTLGVKSKIFLPKNTAQSKLDNIKYHGAEIVLIGDDCSITEIKAKEYAGVNQQTFISPYNDLDILIGQGTIAYEIINSLQDVEAVYASVGGGGLISGVSGYCKFVNKDINVVGCLPENSPVMYESIKAGKIVECNNKPTLSDGTAGNIEQGSLTFDFCKENVDQYTLVTEDEIKDAFKLLLTKEHILVEGAAAVALAAAIKNKNKITGKKVVIVICGSNIDEAKILEILSE